MKNRTGMTQLAKSPSIDTSMVPSSLQKIKYELVLVKF